MHDQIQRCLVLTPALVTIPHVFYLMAMFQVWIKRKGAPGAHLIRESDHMIPQNYGKAGVTGISMHETCVIRSALGMHEPLSLEDRSPCMTLE